MPLESWSLVGIGASVCLGFVALYWLTRGGGGGGGAAGGGAGRAPAVNNDLRSRRVRRLDAGGGGGGGSGGRPSRRQQAGVAGGVASVGSGWEPLPQPPAAMLSPDEAAARMMASTTDFFDKQEALERERRLRAEQELEFQQALQADQEKDALRQVAEAEAREAEARAAEARADGEMKQAMLMSMRLARQNRLPAEPAAGEAGPDEVSVSFRLRGGRRIGRRFRCTDTVQMLEDFVVLTAADEECFGGDHGEQQGAAAGEAGFQLSTMYPTRTLSDMSQTLKDVGIRDREVLALKERIQ